MTEESTRDLRADVELDEAIRPGAPRPNGAAAPVFVTGATGFIGAHVVDALLERGVPSVLCLARAESIGAAKQRVLANLRKLGLSHPRAESAIEVVHGDLASPRFGLTSADFDALGARIGAIVHSGAWVHLSHGYEVLRPSNVWGTREAIRLAVTGGTKSICHVSGMSVFLDTEKMTEQAPPPFAPQSHGGYFDTKWVAEQLVWKGFERAIPGSVVRVGWIAGDSKLGRIPDADAMTMFVRACARLGAAPRLPGGEIQCTPVDLAARVIVHAVLEGPGPRGCNLWSTHTFREEELWSALGAAGKPIELLPPPEWLARLEARFPMLLPVADVVFRKWNYPAREDAVAQALVRRVGGVPSNAQLLAAYVPVWLRQRTGAGSDAARRPQLA